nr:hypothetical protein [Tanacetum cinerariifolium]
MMTCHIPIRPAASRRHMAASYWTAASDVAPTSAPVNAVGHGGDRRSTTVAGGEPSLTATGPPDHRSTVVGKQSTLDMGRVWIGSGPG